MRVLVTGGGGQLATDVERSWTSSGDEVLAPRHQDLDITDAQAVHDAVRAIRPHVIVHCAAWTAVDACEGDEARAMRVNADGARHVAEAAASNAAHLVHVSTDYVFSGEAPNAYIESDPTGPINAYGRSKLAAEIAVQSIAPGATIVRTSWVCGELGPNIVKTVLRLMSDGKPLRFVNDQWGCPTFSFDLAPLLHRVAADRMQGIVHATNAGLITWYEFARSIVGAAGADPDLVQPIRSEELVPARPARRPRFSALANTRLDKRGDALLPDYGASLRLLVARLLDS